MTEKCKRCSKNIVYENDDGYLICPNCGWERNAAIKYANDNIKNNYDPILDKSIFGVKTFDNYFSYRGEIYYYSNIKDIDASIKNISHSLNYMPNGRSRDVWIIIKFYKGKSIFFSCNGSKSFSVEYPELSPEQQSIINFYYFLKREAKI